eukprot:13466676-Ditylum_brightwellii.AAC.1
MAQADPLGDWLTTSPYTAQMYYYIPEHNQVLRHVHSKYQIYEQCSNRVIFYQSSGITVSSLPELAKFTSAQRFGSLLVCRVQINNIQLQVQTQSDNASTSISTFQFFIAQQPKHKHCLLGILKAEEVDSNYWINAITKGQITIVTDGSVAQRK